MHAAVPTSLTMAQQQAFLHVKRQSADSAKLQGQRESTSCQDLRRPQLVSARDVLQQMRGCAHLMRLPVHLLRLDAAHVNLPTAELQQHSMPHNAQQPPLCSVTNSYILLNRTDHHALLVGAFWDLVISFISLRKSSWPASLCFCDCKTSLYHMSLCAEEMRHNQRTCDTCACMHKMVARHTCGA